MASHGNTRGNQAGVAVAALLATMMGMRAVRGGRFMPAGLVATIATVAALYNVHALSHSA